jgi:hypothetical protein
LGANKKETRRLRDEFEKINPKMVNIPYPKERGKH